MHAFSHSYQQSGASLVEFTIIAIPLLSLLLGGIEISQWYFTRQTLGLSLLEAGRNAITNNNHPKHIINAFEQSLLPLYAGSNTSVHNNQTRLNHALNKRTQTTKQPAWQIKVLSPSNAAFVDFHDNNLNSSDFKGHAAINNNYLELQNQNGIGTASNQDIYQANTLTLSLTWQHKPVLPLIKPILRSLGNKDGDYKQKALYSGYIPIQREISMIMQSHPVQWPSDPSGKVIFDWDIAKPTCKGWLCGLNLISLNNNNSGQANNSNDSSNNIGGLNNYLDNNNTNNNPTTNNSEETLSEVLTDQQYQELCGVTLCCIDWEEME